MQPGPSPCPTPSRLQRRQSKGRPRMAKQGTGSAWLNILKARPLDDSSSSLQDRLVESTRLGRFAAMREIQASEAKTHLPQLLDDVERGETIVITRHGRAIARIVPEAHLRQQEIDQA